MNVRPLPAFLAAAEPKAAVVPLRASKRRAWLSPALTTLAAAALVLVAMRLPLTGGDVRAKGAVGRLEVYVQRTGETGARPLEGAEVHPGDVLQWVVSLREARWVAIVGSDSAGVASVYFPRADIAATNATWVAAVTDVRLDASLTLDDTLGRETIVALFCVEAPTTIGIDAVAAGCESQRIELTKTARPAP